MRSAKSGGFSLIAHFADDADFTRRFWLESSSMSKRRSSERGAGETSGRASKLQCPGISGNNAKRAGPFILGPRLGNSPVPSIVQCLARKDGTDDFYQLKILTLEERVDSAGETQEERQGKMLLHTGVLPPFSAAQPGRGGPPPWPLSGSSL
ncbi:Serine/threonine-protein kinase 40 [Larimichthys crocea]|uniref:Serine/threonine-protein kinase 40 n=1 Tax=Larimichthys crocea TaxID=215358 RepID=A0A6G0ICF0_LARCR|nr:Serine/threonine-protein kinase 40 [Larimichthys crocea]